MNSKFIYEFLECKFSDLSKLELTRYRILKGVSGFVNRFTHCEILVFEVFQYDIYPNKLFVKIGLHLSKELNAWFISSESPSNLAKLVIVSESWILNKVNNSEFKTKMTLN